MAYSDRRNIHDRGIGFAATTIVALTVASVLLITTCFVLHCKGLSNKPQSGPVIIPEDNQTTEQAQIPENEPEVAPEPTFLDVHFIDVGQADAALVSCDGHHMLIDGGNNADSSLMFSYLRDHDVTHLDYIIATHIHEDHIGGLSGALNFASVSKVYCTTSEYDSKVFSNLVKYTEKHGAEIEIPSVGDEFMLGGASVKILAVNSTSEINDTSIVLKIVHGENSFIFTGDAERATEQIILESGEEIKADVLKVGHHGSENATTYPFLREVMPKYAVISVGEGNTYGHPTEAVLSRLRDAEATVLRTDFHGDIIFESDGMNLTVTTEK